MTNQLPLMVFPKKRDVKPEKGRLAFGTPPHLPTKDRQIIRLGKQLDELKNSFDQYKASLSRALSQVT